VRVADVPERGDRGRRAHAAGPRSPGTVLGLVRVLLDTSPRARGMGGTAVYVERLAEALAQEGVQVLDCADSSRRSPGGGGPRSVVNAAHDLA